MFQLLPQSYEKPRRGIGNREILFSNAGYGTVLTELLPQKTWEYSKLMSTSGRNDKDEMWLFIGMQSLSEPSDPH